MSVKFSCPSCGKKLRLSKKPSDGRQLKCPNCDHQLVFRSRDSLKDDGPSHFENNPVEPEAGNIPIESSALESPLAEDSDVEDWDHQPADDDAYELTGEYETGEYETGDEESYSDDDEAYEPVATRRRKKRSTTSRKQESADTADAPRFSVSGQGKMLLVGGVAVVLLVIIAAVVLNDRTDSQTVTDTDSSIPGASGSASTQAAERSAELTAAELDSVESKLKEIGHAWERFIAENGFYQPTPELSWRVHLLPYFDRDDLKKLHAEFDLNQPWDASGNRQLVERIPDVFVDVKPATEGKTRLRVFSGKNSIFDEREDSKRAWSVRFVVKDGTSNTILVARAGLKNAQEWTRPGGLQLNRSNPYETLGTLEDDVLWCVFANGRSGCLPKRNLPNEILLRLVDPRDTMSSSFNPPTYVAFDRRRYIGSIAIIQKARARQSESAVRLKRMFTAVQKYAAANGALPRAGAGNPGAIDLSWRILILEHLLNESELEEIFGSGRFNLTETVNSADNDGPATDFDAAALFQFPGSSLDTGSVTFADIARREFTYGNNPEKLFDSFRTRRTLFPSVHVFCGPDAPFGEGQSLALAEISDSKSETIMLIVDTHLFDRGMGARDWSYGGGVTFRSLSKLGKFGVEGFPIVMFDGTVRLLKKDVDDATLARLINPRDGQPVKNLDQIAPVWGK